jgi:HEAT repeat protein
MRARVMREMQPQERCGVGARRYASIGLAALVLLTGTAVAQINSNQMRQRYEKHTKGTSVEDFVKNLSSSDPDKRLEGVKSLGASKDPKAIEYLVQAVGDTDVRVQVKAIQMLGDLRANDATPILVQYLFLRTTDPKMKQLILAALGKIGDTRAAQPLIEFLHRDLDRATRGTAIFALGEIGAPESVEPLEHIAQADSDPTVRRLANEAKSKVEAHQAVIKSQVKEPYETFLKPKGPAAARE